MADSENPSFWEQARLRVHSSITAKLLLIGLVLLLCQIPVLMISNLTRQRENLANSVEIEVSEKWGGRQCVTGPLLVIPVEREYTERQKDGSSRVMKEYSAYHAVPNTFKAEGQLFPEIRYRGIYEVVLYRSKIVLKGDFESLPPIPAQWTPKLNEACLVLGLSDIKGIIAVEAKIDNHKQPVVPGTGVSSVLTKGLSVNVGRCVRKQTFGTNRFTFEITLELNGCRDLNFWPVGRTTQVELSSPWATPSFGGAFLPQQRSVSEEGFRAEWAVSEFNRSCPASWVGRGTANFHGSAFGVSLIKQVSSYALVKRAVSYDVLVYLIVLIAFLIAEKMTKSWIHPLQYFVAGLSLVLFYSILLAFSEHLVFNRAFLIAAAITVGLAFFYSMLILGRKKAAGMMAGVVAAAYVVIFIILRLEDYALLAGSGALLALLVVLMFFTGHINREEK